MATSNPVAGNQFAVVTGASSGIGFELAKLFAENGFDLLIVAEDAGIETAAQTLRQSGRNVEAVCQNLATAEGVDATYQAIKSSGRPVDAIALNAGITTSGAFVDSDLRKDLECINLNVISTTHLAKHVLRDMKARNQGRVLFTASIVSEMPSPYQAVYAATKAYILSFAVALRHELKDTDITITALQPGATETNIFHRAGLDDTRVGQAKKESPAKVARQGFDALMAGEESVVAGSLLTKAIGVLENVIPDSILAEAGAKAAEPGSAKKAG